MNKLWIISENGLYMVCVDHLCIRTSRNARYALVYWTDNYDIELARYNTLMTAHSQLDDIKDWIIKGNCMVYDLRNEKIEEDVESEKEVRQ